jgi:hypothetical protein
MSVEEEWNSSSPSPTAVVVETPSPEPPMRTLESAPSPLPTAVEMFSPAPPVLRLEVTFPGDLERSSSPAPVVVVETPSPVPPIRNLAADLPDLPESSSSLSPINLLAASPAPLVLPSSSLFGFLRWPLFILVFVFLFELVFVFEIILVTTALALRGTPLTIETVDDGVRDALIELSSMELRSNFASASVCSTHDDRLNRTTQVNSSHFEFRDNATSEQSWGDYDFEGGSVAKLETSIKNRASSVATAADLRGYLVVDVNGRSRKFVRASVDELLNFNFPSLEPIPPQPSSSLVGVGGGKREEQQVGAIVKVGGYDESYDEGGSFAKLEASIKDRALSGAAAADLRGYLVVEPIPPQPPPSFVRGSKGQFGAFRGGDDGEHSKVAFYRHLQQEEGHDPPWLSDKVGVMAE